MMHRPTPRAARVLQRGFTILEALIAMAVIAFGLMGVAGIQALMARNTDVAKQRSEATRLAQQQIEQMRSFGSIAAVAGQVAWDTLANGSDTLTTNTTYTRAWTIAGSASDPMRRVSVNVAWTDRVGEANSVTLNSVISKTDPIDVGLLGFPLPQNSTLKRPKNRNINIPIPALDLGNGKSVYQMSSNLAVVFSNDSGYVVMKCTFVVTSATQLSSCSEYSAYILAGYVSKSGSNFPSGLGIDTALLSGTSTIDCTFEDAYDQNSPDLNGNGVIDSTERVAIAGYKYYLCVIAVPQGGSWSGKVRLRGMQTGSNYLVCRFQFPAATGVTSNQRNAQPYSAVNESLDNQNYVIENGSSCPTIDGFATTLHQNCRSSNPNANPNRATDCPA